MKSSAQRKTDSNNNDHNNTPVSPAAICAEIESAGGQRERATHSGAAASQPLTGGRAVTGAQPMASPPASGIQIVEGEAIRSSCPTEMAPALDTPIPDGAKYCAQPIVLSPHQEHQFDVEASSLSQPTERAPHVEPYTASEETLKIIDAIRHTHSLRQRTIAGKVNLTNQMKAVMRSILCTTDDFEEDTTTERETAYGRKPVKLTDDAQKRIEKAYKSAIAELEVVQSNPDNAPEPGPLAMSIEPWAFSMVHFERKCKVYERELAKMAKKLPVYPWVKSIKGFGDVSFATLVGECGDIGSYRNPSCLWKRLGLAVLNGKRQGNPGEGATKEDWIEHGYRAPRRSVSWNARQQIIGGMGKWRPDFGEDVRANPDLTEYQILFAERARLEAVKLDLPVTESDKGKESYKKHVSNRAHRYVEKRLLRELYAAWRAAGRE